MVPSAKSPLTGDPHRALRYDGPMPLCHVPNHTILNTSATADRGAKSDRPMHFAAFCPPYSSHLRAFAALAKGLADRGHRVTFMLPPDCALPLQHPGIDVLHVGDRDPGCGGMQGRAIASSARRTDELCREADRLPAFDAVLGDQMEPAGGLIAAYRDVPLISVACALPLERDKGVPLPFLGWPFDPSNRGLRRNRGGERVARIILRHHNAVISDWADRFGIGPRAGLADCLSPVLTVSQTLPGFDFPRTGSIIVETGLLRQPQHQAFPEDIRPDPSRPFVYASLGTVQGHRLRLLRKIADACSTLNAQLLICHAGGLSPEAASTIRATWVRDFIPQEAILDRADVCITHAGLNTAMEALVRGVPMLAIPIAFDQPGVAARLVHHGAALRHSHRWMSSGALASSIRQLLRNPQFAQNASSFSPGGGVALAVERIEETLSPIRQLVAAQ